MPVNVSTHLFDSLVRSILAYNCEIWNRDVSYFNATERGKKNNFNVDQMQFIETTPYDKIYNKLCKFILGIKKIFKQLFSLIWVGKIPNRLFHKDSIFTLWRSITCSWYTCNFKRMFSLSKSLHEKGFFSWYLYINHVRTKNKMDLGNQDMKKNSSTKYYKHILFMWNDIICLLHMRIQVDQWVR